MKLLPVVLIAITGVAVAIPMMVEETHTSISRRGGDSPPDQNPDQPEGNSNPTMQPPPLKSAMKPMSPYKREQHEANTKQAKEIIDHEMTKGDRAKIGSVPTRSEKGVPSSHR
jgi:hypothetical protein